MNQKTITIIFMAIGSSIFGSIPMLWGDGFLSMTSVVLTAIGGGLGVYVGYKLSS